MQLNANIKDVSQTLLASMSSITHSLNAEVSSSFIYAISPTARIDSLSNGNYLITITDKLGTTAAEIPGISSFIKIGTREQWRAQPSFVSEAGVLYIYSNYKTKEENDQIIYIPGIKIGDGVTYIEDLPFLNEDIEGRVYQHISNNVAHISSEERTFWNNKVRCYNDDENLIFTTN